LRVGLATVLGIRTVTQLPLVVVPTLEGMAWNLRGATMPLCPVINSRRGEVYWALFQWRGTDQLERREPEQVGPAETLGTRLSGAVVVYGEGWEREKAAISASAARAAILTEAAEQMRPSAVSVGMAGLVRLARGERVGMGVSPLYVQRPEAELQYEQSGGVSPVVRRQEKVAQKLRNRLAKQPTRPKRGA
jgi:tRNA threonylcarbamoyladenosine biosynthesis protein TsaB